MYRYKNGIERKEMKEKNTIKSLGCYNKKLLVALTPKNSMMSRPLEVIRVCAVLDHRALHSRHLYYKDIFLVITKLMSRDLTSRNKF